MSGAAAVSTRVKKPPRARRTFTRRQRVTITVLNLALFAFTWEMAPVVLGLPPLFLPRLSEVVAQIGLMHAEGILIENVLVSLRVYLTGMAFSIAVAVPLGFALGGVKVLDRIISPDLWAIYTTPLIILMPLILLWVGINETARVLLVFVSSVPAVVVVVMEGVKTVDNSLLRAARSFGAGRLRLFTHVIVPSTIPFIGTGVKMGMSRGLIGLFVGELLTQATGIGYLITLAQKAFNIPRVFALISMFIAFSVAMVGASQYVERRLSVWRTSSTV
jgi:ABC-type nitrate/sulfonate/bicarbonate transport system permease component